jgi:membrane-associated phospholipid phosphatase
LPLLYLLYEIRRQRPTDRHVRLREQRPRILAFAIISITFLLLLLIALDAPGDLIRLVAAGVVGLVSVTLVTLAWKISIHGAIVAGSAVTMIILFGWALLMFLPIVALTAWSRVMLRDQTPSQVIAGTLLGTTVAGIMFGLLR